MKYLSFILFVSFVWSEISFGMCVAVISKANSWADELPQVIEMLNEVGHEAKNLRSDTSHPAEGYLEKLTKLQTFMAETSVGKNTKVQLIDRYDFGGLPIPPILRNSPREAQEKNVLLDSGTLEYGKALLAPALEVIPDPQGGFIAQWSQYLKDSFGVRLIVEPEAFANPGAGAAYSNEGNYISLPLTDLIANAVSYETFHEVAHMLRDKLGEVGNFNDPLNVDLRGDGVAAILGPKSVYQRGFALDEFRAYPFGTAFSGEFRGMSSSQAEQILVPVVSKSAGGYIAHPVNRFGNVYQKLSEEKHQWLITNQTYNLVNEFIKVMNVIGPQLMKLQELDKSSVGSVTHFVRESLIFVFPEEMKIQISIDLLQGGMEALFGGDLKAADETVVSIVDKKNEVSFGFKVSPDGFDLARETLNNMQVPEVSDLPADSPFRDIFSQVLLLAQAKVIGTQSILQEMDALQTSLRQAIDNEDLETAQSIIKRQARIFDRTPITYRSVENIIHGAGE